MRVLIVHCHPEPNSFNAALTTAAAEALRACGHSVEVSDLYKQGFDPVERADHYSNRAEACFFSPLAEQRHASSTNALPSDVQREIERLQQAHLVVLQFPIWWHSIPAMMKGWFDRVFVAGRLYNSKMRYDRGYFRGKRAICSVTSGAPAASYEPGGRGGEISQILWSTQYSLYYMGFDVLPPFVTFGVQGHGFSYAGEEEFQRQMEKSRSGWIKRLEQVETDEPLAFPRWDDWDEMGRPRPNSRS